MYELGWGYQQKTVPPDDAFELAQLIAEEMATELRLSAYAVQPIEPPVSDTHLTLPTHHPV